LLSVSHSFAEDVKVWLSPNHACRAVAKTISGPQYSYTDYQVIKIFDQKKNLLAALSLEEGSGIDRAMILYAKWSDDSRFFVFMTESSGGHSSWHEPTYIYDATTSFLYSIDDSLGATTSSSRELTITPTDEIQLDFYNFQFEKDSDPYSFTKTVSLPDFVKNGAKIAIHSIRYKR
jgi:hypothetical protein